MKKTCLFGLLLLSVPAFASDWHLTYYYKPLNGSLLIDKDSIAETKDSKLKFWTLYAPQITIGQPSLGYAYNKTLHLINCTDRTASIAQVINYDENQAPHNAEVPAMTQHDIVPDSEEDYLSKYVCKPDQQKKLATPESVGVSILLEDQAKTTKRNDRLLKRTNVQ